MSCSVVLFILHGTQKQNLAYMVSIDDIVGHAVFGLDI